MKTLKKLKSAMLQGLTLYLASSVASLPLLAQSFSACGSNICASSGASVGIGTTTPGVPLEVNGPTVVRPNGSASLISIGAGYDTSIYFGRPSPGSFYMGYDSTSGANVFRGWDWTPFVFQNYETALMSIAMNGNVQVTSTSDSTGGIVTPAWNSFGDNGYSFSTVGAVPLSLGTNNAQRMTILPSGIVGIGTANPCSSPSNPPSNCKLAVAGAIQAQEVVVNNTGWSDYVFAPDYRLAPLDEVAGYIRDNHHLPGIPSEADVRQNGVSLGEVESKLLAKIEELTLHLIGEKQRNDRLEEANVSLAKRMKAIEEAMAK